MLSGACGVHCAVCLMVGVCCVLYVVCGSLFGVLVVVHCLLFAGWCLCDCVCCVLFVVCCSPLLFVV